MLPARVAFCEVSTVSAVEPAVVVTAEPLDDAIFTLDVPLEIVDKEGVAQVASPRQKVKEVAPVPPFKLVTGRFPVTPVVNGNPVAFVNVADTGVPNAVTLPDAFNWGDLDATAVRNTFLVPAENVTAVFELDEL